LVDCRETQPHAIAAEIEAKVDAASRAGTRVLSIHVPAWKDNEALVAETFVRLADHQSWSLNTLKSSKRGGGIRVGLHRVLRQAGGDELEVETVPMVLGTFPHLPASRRCPEPILELSLETQTAKQRHGKLRSDFLTLTLSKLDAEQFKRIKSEVERSTKQVNAGTDSRAHPDVSFTFSPSLASVFNA